MFQNQFNGKRVLVTGHTGFKGSWLCLWLKMLGATVLGISKDIPTSPSHFETFALHDNFIDSRLDICDFEKLKGEILSFNPDFIFHLAAQALVKKSYFDPLETWRVNLMGSLSLLSVLPHIEKKCTVIMITSDKVYKNQEWAWGYRENDILGGLDPYSASKAATDMAIQSYSSSILRTSENISVAIARAGNVIGGGDWAEDRIVPDCIKSWCTNQKVILRSPKSTRPWQHVLEPLSGYLHLAVQLSKNNKLHGQSFNFGPQPTNDHSVEQLVLEMAKHWPDANLVDQSRGYIGPAEANLLKLVCDKANDILEWYPVWGFNDTAYETIKWYKNFYSAEGHCSCQQFSMKQISEYSNLAKDNGVVWTL